MGPPTEGLLGWQRCLEGNEINIITELKLLNLNKRVRGSRVGSILFKHLKPFQTLFKRELTALHPAGNEPKGHRDKRNVDVSASLKWSQQVSSRSPLKL